MKNEWEKANDLGDRYWLYVVFNCNDYNADLRIINNPAHQLYGHYDHYEEKYEIKARDLS